MKSQARQRFYLGRGSGKCPLVAALRVASYEAEANFAVVPEITVLILTLNEELHIARCIKSLQPVARRIVLVDSGSSDATVSIASNLGAEVLHRPWPNSYADQFNWGLREAKIATTWTMRMDADEYLTDDLQDEIQRALSSCPGDVAGFELMRLVRYSGHDIRWGGFFPQRLIRIWRTGQGKCESRLMDEHMEVGGGRIQPLRSLLVDENVNDIHWWTNKHNNYARREAADLLDIEYGLSSGREKSPLHGQAGTKRWLKENVYAHLPLGLRAMSYFGYRFFVRAGFLDHPDVWTFHFLQAAWYRTLVDVNVKEFRREVGEASREKKLEFLEKRWNVRFPANSQESKSQ